MRAVSNGGRQPSLFDGEFVRGDGVVALAGVQDHRGEFGLVGGIGIVLGFQAEGVAAGRGEAALAGSFAVEKIAGVKLSGGLGGPNFQDAAGGGLDDAGGEVKREADSDKGEEGFLSAQADAFARAKAEEKVGLLRSK